MKLETRNFSVFIGTKKKSVYQKKFDFNVNKLRFLEMMGKVAIVKKMDSIGKTVSVCEIKREQYSNVGSPLWLV